MALSNRVLFLWIAVFASLYFAKTDASYWKPPDDENCRELTLIPLCPPEKPPKLCPLCPKPLLFPRVCKNVGKECLDCPRGYKCIQPKNKKGKRKAWGFCCAKADWKSADKKEKQSTKKFNFKKIRTAKKMLKQFFGDDWKKFNRKFKRILIQLKLCKLKWKKFENQFEALYKKYLKGAPVKKIIKALMKTKFASKNPLAAKQMAKCIRPGKDKGGKGKGGKGKGMKGRKGKGGKGKGMKGRRGKGKGGKGRRGRRRGGPGRKGKKVIKKKIVKKTKKVIKKRGKKKIVKKKIVKKVKKVVKKRGMKKVVKKKVVKKVKKIVKKRGMKKVVKKKVVKKVKKVVKKRGRKKVVKKKVVKKVKKVVKKRGRKKVVKKKVVKKVKKVVKKRGKKKVVKKKVVKKVKKVVKKRGRKKGRKNRKY